MLIPTDLLTRVEGADLWLLHSFIVLRSLDAVDCARFLGDYGCCICLSTAELIVAAGTARFD